MPFNYEDVRLT